MITIEIKIGKETIDNKMIVEGDLSIKKSMEIIMILKKYSDELLEQGIKADAKKYKMRKEKFTKKGIKTDERKLKKSAIQQLSKSFTKVRPHEIPKVPESQN